MRLTGLQPLEAIYDRYLRKPRFYLVLLGGLGGLGLLVAGVGVFGVISYSVNRRIHEVGIRMALGATRAKIARLFCRRTVILLLTGLTIGTIGSLWLTEYLRSLLFEVEPADPMTLASVAGVLAAIALLATLIPARRAMVVDPAQTLRSE